MPDGDTILRELVTRSARDAVAFRSFGALASARQYSLLYRLWLEHVPSGAAALDWGAGNGHFGYFLGQSGYQATAFTFTPVSAMDWIGRPYMSIVSGTTDEPIALPFDNATFDAVASVGVLEHVRETGGNELGSLREIARVLRPGGVFVCYHLPNRWSWIDAAAGLIPGKHHHQYRFTRASIEELADGAGLEVIAIKRYGILPRNALRLLPKSLRASRRFAGMWDLFDAFLGAVASPLCQNYAFVARSPRS